MSLSLTTSALRKPAKVGHERQRSGNNFILPVDTDHALIDDEEEEEDSTSEEEENDDDQQNQQHQNQVGGGGG